MRFLVYGYVKAKSANTYEGCGSRHNIYREFSNRSEADRFALHIVEAGKAHYATVNPIN